MPIYVGGKDIRDVRVGGKQAREVWAGRKLTWARGKNEIVELISAGSHSIPFPTWATVAYIIAIGGGSAGFPGDGGFSKQGSSGNGGHLRNAYYSKPSDGATISVTIGKGGTPDSSNRYEPKVGNPSLVNIYSKGGVVSIEAPGGSGAASSVEAMSGGHRDGWSLGGGATNSAGPLVFSEFNAMFPRVRVPCEPAGAGSTRGYRFGSAYTSPGASGQYSAGGAGGYGGTFGNFGLGGSGGDGVAIISFWSEPPAGVSAYD